MRLANSLLYQTVGMMGGYIQGGGHSPLSSIHGMAADHVLSMEVVTADGRFVTADFNQNTDLFWALRGGGGSTFGVVTSVTVKAYPDLEVTASTFSFSVGGNITSDDFYGGIRDFMDYFPDWSSQGIYAYWFIIGGGTATPTFLMQPFWAPEKGLAETNAILAPWFAQLAARDINLTPKTVHYDSFYTGWLAAFPLEVVEKTHVATGSRLFPKQNWNSTSSLDATFDAIKTSATGGMTIIGFLVDPNAQQLEGETPDNAVNPAWRNTYAHVLQSVNWADGANATVQAAARQSFTFNYMQNFRDVSPGAGSYLGESDILEPNFQQSFYGTNYDRLLQIKKSVDPKDVFFAQTAVGSENWQVVTADGLPSGNGRLCRV
jgi:FAD/FMN-containing dehydrogenase